MNHVKKNKFGNYAIAKLEAQKVANKMECNVPIYFKEKYFYLWIGDDLIEWVKPVIQLEDDEC